MLQKIGICAIINYKDQIRTDTHLIRKHNTDNRLKLLGFFGASEAAKPEPRNSAVNPAGLRHFSLLNTSMFHTPRYIKNHHEITFWLHNSYTESALLRSILISILISI